MIKKKNIFLVLSLISFLMFSFSCKEALKDYSLNRLEITSNKEVNTFYLDDENGFLTLNLTSYSKDGDKIDNSNIEWTSSFNSDNLTLNKSDNQFSFPINELNKLGEFSINAKCGNVETSYKFYIDSKKDLESNLVYSILNPLDYTINNNVVEFQEYSSSGKKLTSEDERELADNISIVGNNANSVFITTSSPRSFGQLDLSCVEDNIKDNVKLYKYNNGYIARFNNIDELKKQEVKLKAQAGSKSKEVNIDFIEPKLLSIASPSITNERAKSAGLLVEVRGDSVSNAYYKATGDTIYSLEVKVLRYNEETGAYENYDYYSNLESKYINYGMQIQLKHSGKYKIVSKINSMDGSSKETIKEFEIEKFDASEFNKYIIVKDNDLLKSSPNFNEETINSILSEPYKTITIKKELLDSIMTNCSDENWSITIKDKLFPSEDIVLTSKDYTKADIVIKKYFKDAYLENTNNEEEIEIIAKNILNCFSSDKVYGEEFNTEESNSSFKIKYNLAKRKNFSSLPLKYNFSNSCCYILIDKDKLFNDECYDNLKLDLKIYKTTSFKEVSEIKESDLFESKFYTITKDSNENLTNFSYSSSDIGSFYYIKASAYSLLDDKQEFIPFSDVLIENISGQNWITNLFSVKADANYNTNSFNKGFVVSSLNSDYNLYYAFTNSNSNPSSYNLVPSNNVIVSQNLLDYYGNDKGIILHMKAVNKNTGEENLYSQKITYTKFNGSYYQIKNEDDYQNEYEARQVMLAPYNSAKNEVYYLWNNSSNTEYYSSKWYKAPFQKVWGDYYCFYGNSNYGSVLSTTKNYTTEDLSYLHIMVKAKTNEEARGCAYFTEKIELKYLPLENCYVNYTSIYSIEEDAHGSTSEDRDRATTTFSNVRYFISDNLKNKSGLYIQLKQEKYDISVFNKERCLLGLENNEHLISHNHSYKTKDCFTGCLNIKSLDDKYYFYIKGYKSNYLYHIKDETKKEEKKLADGDNNYHYFNYYSYYTTKIGISTSSSD